MGDLVSLFGFLLYLLYVKKDGSFIRTVHTMISSFDAMFTYKHNES